MFIEILFKMLLFKGGVLIYAEHCMYIYIYIYLYIYFYNMIMYSRLILYVLLISILYNNYIILYYPSCLDHLG